MTVTARCRRILVVGLALSATTACQLPRFGAPHAATKQGADIQRLWSGFFVVAVGVLLLVWLLLGWVLLRYRRRPGDDSMPSQKAYNIPMEILYSAVPVLIVIALFAFSVHTEDAVDHIHKGPAVDVEVIGFQWAWQFRYPDDGIVVNAAPGTPPKLVLPIGEPAHLRLVSNDVDHSFWVPRFLSKRDLIPGVRNEIEVTPTKAGSYIGRCAEFCGLDHWRMYFEVDVVSQADYRHWVATQKAGHR